jgi:nitrogen fixation protein NifX
MPLQRHLKLIACVTEDDWMESAIKVAFASTDLKHVNQHFGASQSFALYAVDQERARLIEVVQFGRLAMDGNEDKLAAKIKALEGCVAVYAQAVGASAAGQLKAMGIQPVKVSDEAGVQELIESLQEQLRLGPAVWLAQAIERQKPADPNRFAVMEAEGWEE